MKFNYLKLISDVLSAFLNTNFISAANTNLINRLHDFFMKNFMNDLLIILLSSSEGDQV